MITVYPKTEMERLLKEYTDKALFPNQPSKMRCSYNGSKIWEINLCYRHGIFVNLIKESDFSAHVLDAFSTCGAFDMSVSIGLESKNLSDSDWKNWFLDKVASKVIVVDTNFVIRHYFSSIIAHHFNKEELNKLSLYMPRMVVLEIERQGNDKHKNKSENGKAGSVEGKEKRLAFYAAKEIHDLRKIVDFHMIPIFDASLMLQFSDRAGKGFSDMWIRKEIHDLIRYGASSSQNTIFITCDLLNSMAGEAEGLTSCYFNKLPKEKFNVNLYDSQFFDFLIANAVIFGEVKIDLLANNEELKDSFMVEGVWNGKTTSEWYSDSLRVNWLKVSEH